MDCKDTHKINCSVIHSHPLSDLKEVANTEGLVESEVLYYLPQNEMLMHFYGLWGMNMDRIMKLSTDDKLRLLGILLTIEEMPEYILDVLNKT